MDKVQSQYDSGKSGTIPRISECASIGIQAFADVLFKQYNISMILSLLTHKMGIQG